MLVNSKTVKMELDRFTSDIGRIKKISQVLVRLIFLYDIYGLFTSACKEKKRG
jgi:hypothetical protein